MMLMMDMRLLRRRKPAGSGHAHQCAVVGEFAEVESGNTTDLPELARALKQPQRRRAALLCVEPSRLGCQMHFWVKQLIECKRRRIAVLFVKRG
jgi:DNA invertase Pin-like site-specific DNA recombinase